MPASFTPVGPLNPTMQQSSPIASAIANMLQIQKLRQQTAQANVAPQLYGGQAAAAQGIGQQELGLGKYAAPNALANLQQQQQAAQQAGILTQQQQQLLKIWPTLTTQQKLQAIAQTTQQQAKANYANRQQQAEVASKYAGPLNVIYSHPNAAAATLPVSGRILSDIADSSSTVSQNSPLSTPGFRMEGQQHIFIDKNGNRIPSIWKNNKWVVI